jgi:hypothetical protein
MKYHHRRHRRHRRHHIDLDGHRYFSLVGMVY